MMSIPCPNSACEHGYEAVDTLDPQVTRMMPCWVCGGAGVVTAERALVLVPQLEDTIYHLRRQLERRA